MSEQIAVITTGGTIGSVVKGTVLGVDPTEQRLNQEITRLCSEGGFQTEVISALNKNSEDFAPEDWGAIVHAIATSVKGGIKRIVVTHGTDTLCYSAAAAAILFRDCDVRICFTGSFYSLENPESDASLNLLAAFACVGSNDMPNGVFVAFRSDGSNSSASIMSAFEVKPMGFDQAAFVALHQNTLASYSASGKFEVNTSYSARDYPGVPLAEIPNIGAIVDATKVLQEILSNPGSNWKIFERSRSGLEAVIIGLYHSGTGSTGESYFSLEAFIRANSADMAIFLAAFPKTYLERPYESTQSLINAGAHVYSDVPAHVLYMFALLRRSVGTSWDSIVSELSPWEYRL